MVFICNFILLLHEIHEINPTCSLGSETRKMRCLGTGVARIAIFRGNCRLRHRFNWNHISTPRAPRLFREVYFTLQ